MKAVILAGGLGTRLSEETILRPKPMVEIGGKPILWHIMKIYSAHGINDFIICLGYKGDVIKDYFKNYFLHTSDITFDVRNNEMHVQKTQSEPWKVTLVDTGLSTMVGGRIKRILPYVKNEEMFCLTYGDGVADVDISASIEAHKLNGKLVTVTGVQPPGRFGALKLDGTNVIGFSEKPNGEGGWINGGFFVLSPKIGQYIEGDGSIWEREPMEKLTSDSQVSVFFHKEFWQPMDTLRDKKHLEDLWAADRAPWKVW